jgi:glycosyltransferase involved in cell wall biosynthesis
MTTTARSTTAERLRILALPRDGNPYQELLYGPMRQLGVQVHYAGELTRSRTANQLLLFGELLWWRLKGASVLHVHWLFGFRLSYAHRYRHLLIASRLLMEAVLLTARLLGYKLVWTAHNVLPHAPIFDDDVAARRFLVRLSDVVIVHNRGAIEGLRAIGASPGRAAIVPPGAYDVPGFETLPDPPARPPLQLLFFGLVLAYKGLEDLLEVLSGCGPAFALTIAGGCPDPGLRLRLEALARPMAGRVTLRFVHIPDAELPELFAATHVVVLPFRSITTSSSVLLSMASGRPVLVPDLPAFSEIPDDALLRYEAGRRGLRAALLSLADCPEETLKAVGRAGRLASMRPTWSEVAQRTLEVFAEEPGQGHGDKVLGVAAADGDRVSVRSR